MKKLIGHLRSLPWSARVGVRALQFFLLDIALMVTTASAWYERALASILLIAAFELHIIYVVIRGKQQADAMVKAQADRAMRRMQESDPVMPKAPGKFST